MSGGLTIYCNGCFALALLWCPRDRLEVLTKDFLLKLEDIGGAGQLLNLCLQVIELRLELINLFLLLLAIGLDVTLLDALAEDLIDLE